MGQAKLLFPNDSSCIFAPNTIKMLPHPKRRRKKAPVQQRLYSSKATYLQSQRLCAETHSSPRHPLPVNCVKDELPIAEGPSPARLGEKPQGSPSKAATSSACDCKHRGGF